MLTIVSIPKPFVGHIGDIQRNAIASWEALAPDVQIMLIGDELGVAEAARGAGIEHIGGVARNERGTPRLDSAFELAAHAARFPWWCYVNGDIILLEDFVASVERVSGFFETFLMVGECRDLAVAPDLAFGDAAVRTALRARARSEGRLRGWAAMDYFVFPGGLFDPIPPFLIGRACFDNWLVWRARDRGVSVVDATRSVVAIHQSHDYAHVAGGVEEAYYGEEAKHNERLAGGREHIYSLYDASHKLYPAGPPIRYLGSVGRSRERLRAAKASYDFRRQAGRSANRPLRLLAAFGRPSGGSTEILNALATTPGVELTVLYGEPGDVGDARHVHWFPRSIRLPMKPDYPINWAIWNSFHGVRPDCMLISGSEAFAAQAAVAWCLARGIPYLVLADGADSGILERRAAAVLVSASGTAGAGDMRRLPEPPDAAAAVIRELALAARQQTTQAHRRGLRARRRRVAA